MKRPPVKRGEKILTKEMVSQILFCGSFTLAVCLAFLKYAPIKEYFSKGGEVYFLTCFFALFIFSGICNSFNARSPKGHLLAHISGNKAFISIILSVAVIQLTIIYFGGNTFRCTPISVRDLLLCALLSLAVIPADQIRKKLVKKPPDR